MDYRFFFVCPTRAIVFSYVGIKISDLTLWGSGIIFVLNNEIKFNKNKNLKTMATKFYKCNHCGNVIIKAVDGGVTPFCCGEKMTELVANTVEASVEKHLPVVEKIDDCRLRIQVGSVEHPMLPEHHIAFVYVEFEDGGVRIDLKDKPVAEVCVCGRKPIAVYEYCNLHGLWKTDI